MVKGCSRCCLHDVCTTRPNVNAKGSRTPEYCKRHAENGMMNVVKKLCSHDFCPLRANVNVEGKGAKFCKLHARDGIVNVVRRPCLHDTCTKTPSFNVKGSHRAIYCDHMLRTEWLLASAGASPTTQARLGQASTSWAAGRRRTASTTLRKARGRS